MRWLAALSSDGRSGVSVPEMVESGICFLLAGFAASPKPLLPVQETKTWLCEPEHVVPFASKFEN